MMTATSTDKGSQEDMMKLKQMSMALILGSTLALGSSACVKESPSILLNGSFALTGSVTTEEIDGVSVSFLTCKDLPSDVTSGNFWSKGQINIQLLKECGQFCGYDGVISGIGGLPNTFTFMAGAQNLLPDSRSVGTRGGTEYLDGNHIWVREALISFPPELNTFSVDGGDLPFDTFEPTSRLMSAYLNSGGGAFFGGINVIATAGELRLFEDFLRNELNIRNEPVTFIAEIQLKGKSQAGTKVESNTVQFPIDICLNCNMMVTPLCVAE
jgi:hypothetical protein